MTPQLLLENIIEKAVQGGWEAPKSYTNYEAFYVEEGKYWIWSATYCDYYNVEKFFFDHSFAKGFFGEKEEIDIDKCDCKHRKTNEYIGMHGSMLSPHSENCSIFKARKSWQYHIQALALTPPEERLSYLEKYL